MEIYHKLILKKTKPALKQVQQNVLKRGVIDSKILNCRIKLDEFDTDISNYNAEKLEVQKRNQMKTDEYLKTVKVFREGAFDTQKDVNETETDYLQRLKANAEILEPDDELITAMNLINKNFV